jgi:transcriptional regulator GlxA family with amidase domain
VGASPGGYHLQLRLEAAREVLLQPAAEIITAALQFGFSSSQHFSTHFHRTFGITPRVWKAREAETLSIGSPKK